jgi:ryanodine receptor 2
MRINVEWTLTGTIGIVPDEEPSMQTYDPQPIDTSAIVLADDIRELTEKLAANTHEVWARTRISQGWSYGPQRDDDARKHPCLVRYEQLPESEKEFDRKTAVETLKLILALGYRIVPPDKPRGNRAGGAQTEAR